MTTETRQPDEAAIPKEERELLAEKPDGDRPYDDETPQEDGA